MMKGLTTTKLIAIGGIATLDFLIGVFASLITIYSGIPLMSGAITAIVGSILSVVCLLMVDTFGTFTVYQLIYTSLALTTFIWGPPGFLPKVLIGLSIGISVDITYHYLKNINKNFSLVLSVLILNLFGTILFVTFAKILGVPGAEKTAVFISSPIYIFAFVLVALFDAWAAIKIFNKIKDTSVVKRIQGV